MRLRYLYRAAAAITTAVVITMSGAAAAVAAPTTTVASSCTSSGTNGPNTASFGIDGAKKSACGVNETYAFLYAGGTYRLDITGVIVNQVNAQGGDTKYNGDFLFRRAGQDITPKYATVITVSTGGKTYPLSAVTVVKPAPTSSSEVVSQINLCKISSCHGLDGFTFGWKDPDGNYTNGNSGSLNASLTFVPSS